MVMSKKTGFYQITADLKPPEFSSGISGAKADCFVLDEAGPVDEHMMDALVYGFGSANLKKYYEGSWLSFDVANAKPDESNVLTEAKFREAYERMCAPVGVRYEGGKEEADCFIVDEIAEYTPEKHEYNIEDVYLYFGGARNIERHYLNRDYKKWLEEIEGGKEEAMAIPEYESVYDCTELEMLEREMERIRERITRDHSLSSMERHCYREEYERLDRRRHEVKRQRGYNRYGVSPPNLRGWSDKYADYTPPMSYADARRTAMRMMSNAPRVTVGIGHPSDLIAEIRVGGGGGGLHPKRAEDITIFKGLKALINIKETKMKIYQVFIVDKATKEIDSEEYIIAKNESHAKLKRVSQGMDLLKHFVAVSCAVANLPEKWDDETS